MSQHDHPAHGMCIAARCHTPTTDAFLCDACVRLLREQLARLAGEPGAARVRDDQPGPWRTQPRQPGRWRDGTPGPDGTTEPATDLPAPEPGQRGPGTVLPEPDRGLLADLEVTATRQDSTEPDTTRPPEVVEDGQRRTKDRPELAPAATRLAFRPGASNVLGDARRVLCQLVCDVLERRYGAILDVHGRAVLRGERLYRSKTAPPRVAGPLGAAHGPWQRLPDNPGRYPAEHAAWLQLHAWTVALLDTTYAAKPDRPRVCAADAVADLVDRAESVLVRPERQCLGLCGNCYDQSDGVVQTMLWADKDADTAECPRCGQQFDVVAYRARMLETAAEQWVTAADATRALGGWVRDVRSRDEAGEVVDAHPDELTAAAIAGYAERGRIAYQAATQAQQDAARAAGHRPPAWRYRLGDIMGTVRAIHAEDLARKRRAALRAGQRRRVPAQVGAGTARAAG